MDITHRVQLHWPQTKAWRALKPGNTVTLAWGRGTGKSWFIRLFWYLTVAAWDGKRRPGALSTGVRIVLLMPTLVQAKKVHLALLQSELANEWAPLGGVLNRTDWRITFPGGSWIQWITAENADGARGVRCDVVTIDEADSVDKEVLDGVLVPWFSEPHSLAIRMIAGTPRRGRYGLLYRAFRCLDTNGQRIPESHAIHATYLDVPEHVSAEYVERERKKIPPEVFKREWLCDFDAAEGLVYDLFKESFHVREPDPRTLWTEILIGGDHGYEDPGVLLVLAVAGTGRDATIHAIEEVSRQHQTESWWIAEAKKLVSKYPTARWYIDPSQPARIEAFRQSGCRVCEVDNSIEDGVSAVADRMVIRERSDRTQFARFYVSPKCAGFIKELGLYRRKRDPRNRERVLDEIQDANNHFCDSARYPIFSRFGKPASTRVEHDYGDFSPT